MDKMTMAHEYVVSRLSNPKVTWSADNLNIIINHSWQYADAMQAEADKRVAKGVPDAISQYVNNYAQAYMNCDIQVVDAEGGFRVTTRQKELDASDWRDSLRKRPEGK